MIRIHRNLTVPAALAVVCLVAFVLREIQGFVNATTVGVVYLITILGEKLAISVRNEGEPLSEAERSRIFDKFYRGHAVRRQVAGTGMGLPVARNILRAQGGDVVLTGSDHQGTEFVMAIPLDADVGIL
jgi:signal transduction histidine kinase